MTIKLNGSTAGSVALDAPASTTGNADINFKLPVADGSANQVMKTDGSGNLAFTSLVSGITEYDMWYLHTNHSADATSIILGRSDSSTANRITNLSSNLRVSAQIGTGMSLDTSTGYYTFPSTGKWLIIVNCHVNLYGDDNAGIITKVTSDNGSNWYSHSLAYTGQDGGTTPHSATSFGFLDITDVSNQKIRFDQDSLGTNSYIIGNSSYIRTSFTFVRIGDT
jgi:hypothetical protein